MVKIFQIPDIDETVAKPPPSHYGIPHDKWRKNQFETLKKLQNSNKEVKILEASTGSGKTTIATALGHEKKSMSLVQTKLLQQSNYGNIYKWNILFGKGNYKCIHPDANFDTTANECLYASKGMHKCPVAKECPYLVQKHITMSSKKASLNYSYYLLSEWPKELPFKFVVMDEAHMLSDITLEFAGISIHDVDREEWNFDDFPVIDMDSGTSLFFNVKKPHEQLRDWLASALKRIEPQLKALEKRSMSRQEKDQKKYKRCKNMKQKLESTLMTIKMNSSHWFIQSGYDLVYYRGRKVPGLIAKPITARHHFPSMFLSHPEIMMMSATIGNVSTFAEELGIDDFEFLQVPSIWPTETRPIYDLGAPRMGYKSTENDYEKQADVIAKAIKDCPGSWEGVIHVTRKDEAPLLGERLSRRGLAWRIWIPPRAGTNIQMQEWEQHKKKYPGSIAIAWSWTEGVDLFDERICISAKVPYPSLGDPFEKARQQAYGRFFLQRTAWKLMQSWGRTRRGERDHYDIDGETNGFVGIADGNWTRIKKYITTDILNSIVPYH